MSLCLPYELELEWVDSLYSGLLERAAEAGVAIVGGNVARSRAAVVVDVTLIGETLGPLLRSGAEPGDLEVRARQLDERGAELEKRSAQIDAQREELEEKLNNYREAVRSSKDQLVTEREELRRKLAMIRGAIDRYHELAVTGHIEPWDLEWMMYPEDLDKDK